MSQSTLISPPSPTVALYNDRPATTSREVAKFFGKRHDNIVRDIRSLISNTPETFHALNFEEMSEDVEIGNGAIRQDPVFLLFRDGFMLLVMGYTGKKAMAIKIAYMEAREKVKATMEKLKGIRGIIKGCSGRFSLHFMEKIHQRVALAVRPKP